MDVTHLEELATIPAEVHSWPRMGTVRRTERTLGVSLAALLYRARALGIMGDVSYRNAMVRMSQNGWRRAEPGGVTSLEMPSMLPRAREVMGSAGIDDDKFLSGSGLPAALYEIAASRVPLTGEQA